MSITNTRTRKIPPTHPGEMLREDFLPGYGLTVSSFAKAIGVSRQTINELLRERRALSPDMALRLARLFGNSAEFWLNAQRAVDLWEAEKRAGKKIGAHISAECRLNFRYALRSLCLSQRSSPGHKTNSAGSFAARDGPARARSTVASVRRGSL